MLFDDYSIQEFFFNRYFIPVTGIKKLLDCCRLDSVSFPQKARINFASLLVQKSVGSSWEERLLATDY
jgi:hypothetical protein